MRAVVRVTGPAFVLLALVAFGGRRDECDVLEGLAPDASALEAEQVPGDDDTNDEDDGGDADDGEPSEDDAESAASDPGAPRATAGDTNAKAPRTGCPKDMVRVGDACMDRYEAPNRKGAKPLVMQTAMDAEEWCAARKKRLCTEDEWIATCEGAQKRAYPYGDEHEDGRCNDDKEWRTVNEATLAKWPAPEAKEHNQSLYQAAKSGSKRRCRSQRGVYDMTGNVEEWVLRSRSHANDYKHILIGCYWSGCYGGGKPTCHSTNSAHGPGFRFYETGFRCCRDSAKKKLPLTAPLGR